jgi:hypothetical protein
MGQTSDVILHKKTSKPIILMIKFDIERTINHFVEHFFSSYYLKNRGDCISKIKPMVNILHISIILHLTNYGQKA